MSDVVFEKVSMDTDDTIYWCQRKKYSQTCLMWPSNVVI